MEINTIAALPCSERIAALKKQMLAEPRYATIEQARIVTKSYQATEGQPRCIQRARALQAALCEITIRIEPDERIVGNRTPGVRGGVVFPETGASWVDREFESLPTRPQDKFQVRPEDIREFREQILPYWKGRSLENDLSQGHICAITKKWRALGPAGIRDEAQAHLAAAVGKQHDFYESVIISMEGAISFIGRYAELAEQMYRETGKQNLAEVAQVCRKLAHSPAETYHEALQATWFLYVILQMEGNASSFSPGRMDQYRSPKFKRRGLCVWASSRCVGRLFWWQRDASSGWAAACGRYSTTRRSSLR